MRTTPGGLDPSSQIVGAQAHPEGPVHGELNAASAIEPEPGGRFGKGDASRPSGRGHLHAARQAMNKQPRVAGSELEAHSEKVGNESGVGDMIIWILLWIRCKPEPAGYRLFTRDGPSTPTLNKPARPVIEPR